MSDAKRGMGFIRTLLALSVADFHGYHIAHAQHILSLEWANGAVAVQTFFVLSGFYMALVLSRKYADKGPITFYRARFLRLFPAYWLACLLTIAVAIATQQTGVFDYWNELIEQRAWTG